VTRPRHSIVGGQWQIMPIDGGMDPFDGFHTWPPGSFAGFDTPPNTQFYMATLPAENLKPDTDYLIWFRFERADPVQLEMAFNLLKVPKTSAEWEALGLEMHY